MTDNIKQLREDEDRYQLHTYAKFPFFIDRGKGCCVYDEGGNEYLDLYGAHAVASTGHCHPAVVKAIREQAGRLIFYSNVAYCSVRARAVKKLLLMAGEPYHQAFFVNSGSEANENAIKLARSLTGRREVISVSGSFHGRAYGSLSATGIPKYHDYLNTPVPNHRILPAEEVARAVSDATAAVLIEPIQSMGGMREVTLKDLKEIQKACQKEGALLIFDEVQTGIGRTGTFLYSGRGGVHPEMVTLAKGIASGFPAGALLVTREVASSVKSGDLGTTFGGGPLASAAIEATLETIEREKLVENAARTGTYLREALSKLKAVDEVLGRGLLIGIKFKPPLSAKAVQQGLLKERILAGSSIDPQVLRLMPPLILGEKEADRLVKALKSL